MLPVMKLDMDYLGLETDDDENEIEDFGAINRSNTKTKSNGIKPTINL